MDDARAASDIVRGERLRRLIQWRYGPRGLKRFAADLRKPPKRVYGYCAGVMPSADTLLDMSALLGVSVDAILKGPMSGADSIAALPPVLQEMLRLAEALTPEQRDAAIAILAALRVCTPEVVQRLVDLAETFRHFFEVPLPGHEPEPPGSEPSN